LGDSRFKTFRRVIFESFAEKRIALERVPNGSNPRSGDFKTASIHYMSIFNENLQKKGKPYNGSALNTKR